MNLYAGTLGQLVLVELFVLWIWVQVLFDAIKNRAPNYSAFDYRKLVITSLGLVINAAAIVGIISYRVYELLTGNWPFFWGVIIFYVMMALSGFLLIVAACIGTRGRLLKIFFSATILWTAFVFFFM